MNSTSATLVGTPSRIKPKVEKKTGRRSPSPSILFIGDCTVVALSMTLAFYFRYILNIGVVDGGDRPELYAYLAHYLAGFGLFMLLAQDQSLYDRDLTPNLPKAASKLLKISVFWAVMFLGFSLILKLTPPISRLFVVYSCSLMCVMLPAWRFLYLSAARKLGLDKELTRRVLIVGSLSESKKISNKLTANRNDPYEIIGLSTPYQERQKICAGVRIVGSIDDLEDSISTYDIDVVVVGDKNLSQPEVLRIARICERSFVEFNLIPSQFEVFTHCLGTKMIGTQPVLGIAELPQNHAFNRVVKRLFDIFGALVGLAITLPITPIIAYLIVKESPGPIIYKQIRSGKEGKTFTIYKFRSMKLSAESDGKAKWCQADDPRRLKIGGFLRKWNLDELPQFWNVLKGDMSLVGPRPERPELIIDFLKEIPHYQSRHSVRPGMTGWAQVNGLRGDTSLEERIRHDLHYIENWSLWLDMVIKIRTLFQYKNAY